MQKLPSSVWVLGFVSLFMDISSEIVHSLLPVFLVSVLGASFTVVGILEGLAEALVLITKLVSGFLSDLTKQRKPLVFLGYTIGTISKPLFAIANSVFFVYLVRLFDRLGKGIRGAPRDALIADLTPQEVRGQAFGIRQSLDTFGAIIGPGLAIFLMSIFSNSYKHVFLFATIPGLISIFLILFFIPEKKCKRNVTTGKLNILDIKNLNRSFWNIVILGVIYKFATFSEAMLILRANNLGLKEEFSPLVLITMSIVYAFSAYPVGYLSDKIKRSLFLLIGVLVLILSNVFLAFANSIVFVLVGVAFWGLQLGFTQGTFSALIVDTCLETLRGTAFGIFSLLSAISLLLSSAIAGLLWDKFGPSSPFMFSGIVAVYCIIQYTLFDLD